MPGSTTSSPLRDPRVDQLALPDPAVTCGARATAARIRSLIAHHDGGDVCAAARRLGVPVRRLVQLDATLDPDPADADGRAALDALLSAAVLRYDSSAAWLLTGCHEADASMLPTEVAQQLASVCLAVAARVVEEFQATAAVTRPA
ncbi:MAG TPA: hypothetical protein VF761_01875 [Gemmatimonadaceae bacterium]